MPTEESSREKLPREVIVAIAIVLFVCVFVALLFAYLLYPLFEKAIEAGPTEPNFTSLLTVSVTVLATPVLLVLACLLIRRDVPPSRAIAENLLSLVIGMLVGWSLAILWVPYGEVDTRIYSQIGGAVALFFSGYVLSKLDRIVDKSLFPSERPESQVITKLSLMFASFALAAITVVTNRVEYMDSMARECPQNQVAQARANAEIQVLRASIAAMNLACPAGKGTTR